jgi:hypothetical protein
MAIPDRDTNYNADGSRRDLYQMDGNTSAGWVIGAIIVVALVIIGYFVFAGRSTAPSGVNVNATPQTTTSAPAVPGPADNTASPNTNATPMTTTPSPAPAAPDTSTTPGASSTPATPAPATPATPAPATPTTAPAAPAADQ